jgi:predicted enzyme related to lactoylglutathione lyase
VIKSYGLTAAALPVEDAKRAFEFYRDVFGVMKVNDR